MDVHHCVGIVPLFDQLNETEQAQIDALVTHQSVQKDETILAPDQEAALIIVANGAMKVTQLTPTGHEQLISIVHPGEYEGESALFGEINENRFGIATTNTVVCRLTQSDFQQVLRTYPDLNFKLMRVMAHRLIQLERQAQFLTMPKIEERLATFLVDLSVSEDSLTFDLPMKLKDVATFLGTTPETLSRQLRRFESHQLIRRSGRRLTLLDLDQLEDDYL
ncbi:Crp/Fnr family transcriptional regulator [Levilactobacillus bambusae]|uniref:Crp/Fnr family transcriptional regulator n=1 Tax=Levilactobacillus bambusae TaxID=2024736 RepID=A0A2V1N5D9_9LACO|nr:Crp/Fnr family transcriptional regulator [Levilactobacillus bambusae]PWG00880.1 Crp/Fnr family transcriptional regulator [Levilactobacillus bambusae]